MSVTAYHFWSHTCAPCKAIKPSIDDLKEEFDNVTWVSVNTHEDKNNFATVYGVKVVPTIVVVALSQDGSTQTTEQHSGINISGYYRILRNGLRTIQQ
jgi:thiol-disulfide isomerase/thioredoxin